MSTVLSSRCVSTCLVTWFHRKQVQTPHTFGLTHLKFHYNSGCSSCLPADWLRQHWGWSFSWIGWSSQWHDGLCCCWPISHRIQWRWWLRGRWAWPASIELHTWEWVGEKNTQRKKGDKLRVTSESVCVCVCTVWRGCSGQTESNLHHGQYQPS